MMGPSMDTADRASAPTAPSVNSHLLRESLEIALDRDGEFPRLFYEILFRDHPELRPLFFRNSLGAQRKMLGQTLIAVVDHFDDPAWLLATLAPMGRDHVAYGVSPEMYTWVGEALRAALAEVCAADWTEAHAAAWRDGYQVIVGAMRAGEARAAAAP
jgi:hemoglobin-like flavoprotein